MNIIITGSTGFIGSAFTKLALSRGHSVAGLIIPVEQVPGHLPPHPNLTWIRGNLDDAPWDEIQRFGADVCVHTAWVTAPGVYLESPDNYKFLESSVKFLRKVNDLGTNHLVGLGTCIEYQITDNKLSEEKTPVVPTTTYSKSKDELRRTMEVDAVERGFKSCWARVFYPYGPREHPSRLCTSIINKFASGEKMTLKTPHSTKDYIFIDDLAEALLAVVEKQFVGSINLGTGIGHSVKEIAETVERLMGKSGLVAEAEPPQVDPLGYVVSDNSRLRSLGWSPKHDLNRGLQALLSFLAKG